MFSYVFVVFSLVTYLVVFVSFSYFKYHTVLRNIFLLHFKLHPILCFSFVSSLNNRILFNFVWWKTNKSTVLWIVMIILHSEFTLRCVSPWFYLFVFIYFYLTLVQVARKSSLHIHFLYFDWWVSLVWSIMKEIVDFILIIRINVNWRILWQLFYIH